MKDLSIEKFIDDTASDSAVPGGGSIAALSGALSAALTEMVANLTIGKIKYKDVETEMMDISKKAELLRSKMLEDMENDCKAFNLVMEAYRLPKDTDVEKKLRTIEIQNKLIIATLTPLQIAENAFNILAMSERVVTAGNINAVSDGLVSAMMARTAVLSALYNVKINLKTITDENFVSEMTEKIIKLEKDTVEMENKILKLASI